MSQESETLKSLIDRLGNADIGASALARLGLYEIAKDLIRHAATLEQQAARLEEENGRLREAITALQSSTEELRRALRRLIDRTSMCGNNNCAHGRCDAARDAATLLAKSAERGREDSR